MNEPFRKEWLTYAEFDVLRQMRGLTDDEWDKVLILISSFKRGLDSPPKVVA